MKWVFSLRINNIKGLKGFFQNFKAVAFIILDQGKSHLWYFTLTLREIIFFQL